MRVSTQLLMLLTVADTDLKNTKIAFEAIIADGLSYPTADLTLRNVICREDSVVFDSVHPVNVLTLG
jgi:hypothetical protein